MQLQRDMISLNARQITVLVKSSNCDVPKAVDVVFGAKIPIMMTNICLNDIFVGLFLQTYRSTICSWKLEIISQSKELN